MATPRMMATVATVDAALDYAERGVPVFPCWWTTGARCACGKAECSSPGKHPIGAVVPNGLKNATTDAATITAWWQRYPQAHIATPTSWCAVLDVDPRHGGDVALEALEREHGRLPDSAEVLTGGGGRHIYFAPVPGLRCTSGEIGTGLDTRAEGGYVLLPPSGHVSGSMYVEDLMHPLFDTPLAPMPGWLQARAMAKAAQNGHGPTEVRDWAAMLAGAPEGQRWDVACQVAGHYLRELGPDREHDVLQIMLGFAARCRPPFPDDEVRVIVRDLAAKDRQAAASVAAPASAASAVFTYLEPIGVFLAEPDPPVAMLFPELLPAGVLMLVHGEPRARKSLTAFELALAAATGTAPFGLSRFTPTGPVPVLYIQEEDSRALTRPRLRRLVRERCGTAMPATLHVSVRRGVDLDDPMWVERLIADCERLGIQLLVLDAARRLSTKADEGPAKVRELIAVVRILVTRAGLTVLVVHHDVKPPAAGQDLRRRSQRASGGDWFAASECPVHVERVNERESLVYPQDYKFAADPAPFTFTCELDGLLIRRLVGSDTSTDHAETAGLRGKLLDWLRPNGPASKTAMKQAGFGWTTLGGLLDGLLRQGLIDTKPGRTAKSTLYFVVGEPSQEREDASTQGLLHAR